MDVFFQCYFMYAGYIKYCLIEMIVQVVFSFLIEKKQIWKVATMVFLTQGIVVLIAEMSYEILDSIHSYTNLVF